MPHPVSLHWVRGTLGQARKVSTSGAAGICSTARNHAQAGQQGKPAMSGMRRATACTWFLMVLEEAMVTRRPPGAGTMYCRWMVCSRPSPRERGEVGLPHESEVGRREHRQEDNAAVAHVAAVLVEDPHKGR